jgi:hypothetical protein
MPPSKVRWGNQNGVVTVRSASRVWRYDLAKIEKKSDQSVWKNTHKTAKTHFFDKQIIALSCQFSLEIWQALL